MNKAELKAYYNKLIHLFWSGQINAKEFENTLVAHFEKYSKLE